MMKKLIQYIKDNLFFMIIGFLFMMMILVIIWPTKKETVYKSSEIKQLSIKNYKIDAMENKVSVINWGSLKTEIPENIEVIKNNSLNVDEKKLAELSTMLGASEMTKIVDNKSLLMLKNEEKGSSIYVNRVSNFVQFSGGYVNESYYKRIINTNDIQIAKNNFDRIIAKLAPGISGGEIKSSGISYQKIIEPKAITSNSDEANIVVFTADVLYKNNKIFTSYGKSLISARYGADGILLEFRMENPTLDLNGGNKVKLLNWNEIKSIKSGDINVFEINGNQEFEISIQNDSITKLDVTSAEIEYFYSPEKKAFLPFLVAEGDCQLSSGPAKVKIGVLLIKDKI